MGAVGRAAPSAALPSTLPGESFGAKAEYESFARGSARALAERRSTEATLMVPGADFTVPAWCHVCARRSELLVDWDGAYPVDGVLTPNWRERLVCPGCLLNSRARAVVHMIDDVVRPPPSARVYVTEFVTPLYRVLARRFAGVVGSEWLSAAVPLGGEGPSGARNEDLTRLTFRERSFDLVVSLDVLEHIAEYRRALAECFRVLVPGGSLVLTCPFRPGQGRNLTRAVMGEGGRVEHLEPPEYHGDPLDAHGVLAFHDFGWELLDDLRRAGFAEVHAHLLWSPADGYLGYTQFVLLAQRPPERSPAADVFRRLGVGILGAARRRRLVV